MWLDGMVLLYLSVIGIWDIKYREVAYPAIWVGVLFVGCHMWWNRMELFIYLCGIALGCFFIVISWITKEGLGYGDSIVILLLGGYQGISKLLLGLSISFFLCAVYGGVIWLVFHKNGTEGIPFIPFLALGYIGGMWM